MRLLARDPDLFQINCCCYDCLELVSLGFKQAILSDLCLATVCGLVLSSWCCLLSLKHVFDTVCVTCVFLLIICEIICNRILICCNLHITFYYDNCLKLVSLG